QMANAFACRSTVVPVWRTDPRTNPLVLAAVGVEAVLLVCFLGIPPLADLLGGAWPTPVGWLAAAAGPLGVIGVDGLVKTLRARARPSGPRASGPSAPEVGSRVPAGPPSEAARWAPTDAPGGVG
ncbi:MAG: cation transporting ATPase C-terminal domain-containing protein, partial [Terrabacter sp.]